MLSQALSNGRLSIFDINIRTYVKGNLLFLLGLYSAIQLQLHILLLCCHYDNIPNVITPGREELIIALYSYRTVTDINRSGN